MSASFAWSFSPFEELGPEEVLELAAVINRANSLENAPVWHIFRQERIDPATVVNDYRGQTLVRLRDGQTLVGTMTLGKEDRFVTISILAIAPEYRGRRLAAEFVEFAASYARGLRREALRLDAVDTGTLVNYYERLGFTEVDRTQWPVGKWDAVQPFELVRMEKSVEPS